MTFIQWYEDPIDGFSRPFYTPKAQKELWNKNWSEGERELLTWFAHPEFDAYPGQKSEMMRMASKKLRESREVYAGVMLNNDWNEILTMTLGYKPTVVVNALDNGSDALLLLPDGTVHKSLEMKSTKAVPKINMGNKEMNQRGDPRGQLTFDYSSSWKFHLSKTENREANLEDLISGFVNDDHYLFMFTICFDSNINGIMDAVLCNGQQAAEIIRKSTGNANCRQVNPSTAYNPNNRNLYNFIHTQRIIENNLNNLNHNNIRLVA